MTKRSGESVDWVPVRRDREEGSRDIASTRRSVAVGVGERRRAAAAADSCVCPPPHVSSRCFCKKPSSTSDRGRLPSLPKVSSPPVHATLFPRSHGFVLWGVTRGVTSGVDPVMMRRSRPLSNSACSSRANRTALASSCAILSASAAVSCAGSIAAVHPGASCAERAGERAGSRERFALPRVSPLALPARVVLPPDRFSSDGSGKKRK